MERPLRTSAVTDLVRLILIVLAEMPGCDVLRTQMGGTRRSPGDVAVAASRRHPNGHGSAQLLHRSSDLQRFVDYGITHTSLDRRGMPRSQL